MVYIYCMILFWSGELSVWFCLFQTNNVMQLFALAFYVSVMARMPYIDMKQIFILKIIQIHWKFVARLFHLT